MKRTIACLSMIFFTLFSSLYTSPVLASEQTESLCGKTFLEEYKYLSYCAAPIEVPDYEIVSEETIVCCDKDGSTSYEAGSCAVGSERIAPTFCEAEDFAETSTNCQKTCEGRGFEWWEAAEPLEEDGYCHCSNQEHAGTKEFEYFVYVNKPIEMEEDMVFEIGGVEDWTIEKLYSDTVTSSGNRIFVKGSTSFIIRVEPEYESCECQESVGCECEGLNGESTCSAGCTNYGGACYDHEDCISDSYCSQSCANSGDVCEGPESCEPKPAILVLVPKKRGNGGWVNDEAVKIVKSENEENCVNMAMTVGYSLSSIRNTYLNKIGIISAALSVGPALATAHASQLFSELLLSPGKNVEAIFTLEDLNNPVINSFEKPTEAVRWLANEYKRIGEHTKENGIFIFLGDDGKMKLLDVSLSSISRTETSISPSHGFGKFPKMSELVNKMKSEDFVLVGAIHTHPPGSPTFFFSAADASSAQMWPIFGLYSYDSDTVRLSIVDNTVVHEAGRVVNAKIAKELEKRGIERGTVEWESKGLEIFTQRYGFEYGLEYEGAFKDIVVKIGDGPYLSSNHVQKLVSMDIEATYIRALNDFALNFQSDVDLYASKNMILPDEVADIYRIGLNGWEDRLKTMDHFSPDMEALSGGLRQRMDDLINHFSEIKRSEFVQYSSIEFYEQSKIIESDLLKRIEDLKQLGKSPSEDSINKIVGLVDDISQNQDELAMLRTNADMTSVSDGIAWRLETGGRKPVEIKRIEQPEITAKMQLGSLMTGISISFVQSLGPMLREKAQLYADTNYLLYANLVEGIGWTDLALTVGLTIMAEIGGFVLPAWVSAMWVVSLANPAVLLIGIASGYALGMLIQFVVGWLDCVWHPWSESCGCSLDPQFAKLQLVLEDSEPPPNGKIGFSVYGVQYCEDPLPMQQAYYGTIEYYDEGASEWKPIHNELIYPMINLPEEFKCRFDDSGSTLWQGSCCEATLDLAKTELETGDYRIRGRFCRVSEGELTTGNCCDFGCEHSEYEYCDDTKCYGYAECEYIEPYYCIYTTDEQTISIEAGVVPTLSSIPLEPGWNLISAPYSSVTLDTSACTLHSKALHYTAAGSYQTVDIGDLEGGVGYWIYSYDVCEIELTGTGNTIDPPTELVAGWNQIAVPLEGLHKNNVQCDQIENPKEWDMETGGWVFVEEMVAGKSYFVDCYPEH